MGAHVLMFDVRFPFLSSDFLATKVQNEFFPYFRFPFLSSDFLATDFLATKVQNEFFPYLQIRIRSAGARSIKCESPVRGSSSTKNERSATSSGTRSER